MHKGFYIFFILIAQHAVAQTKRLPLFSIRNMYMNIDFGFQHNIGMSKLHPLADIRRNAANNGLKFTMLDFGWNFKNNYHLVFGTSALFSKSIDIELQTYFQNKYPSLPIRQSSGNYYAPAITAYLGLGKYIQTKKVSLLPLITIGMQSQKLARDKYLLTNAVNNEAVTFLLDYTDPNWNFKESINSALLGFQTKIFSAKNPRTLLLYAEPYINFWYADLDLSIMERQELSGVTSIANLDYTNFNFNFGCKLGVLLKLSNLK